MIKFKIKFEIKFETIFVKLKLKSYRIQDTSMQIWVKTLTCGTINLDVKANDSIERVRKKIKSKIDDMFTGFDVEILEYVEGNHALVFAGKLLEDGRTLSDYNIQKDNNIQMTSGLAGEGTYIHLQFIII